MRQRHTNRRDGPGGCSALRCIHQVRVLLRGVEAFVAEEMADHHQRLTLGSELRREGVTQVVQPEVLQGGSGAKRVPRAADLAARPYPIRGREDVLEGTRAGPKLPEHIHRHRRQRQPSLACLRIWQP